MFMCIFMYDYESEFFRILCYASGMVPALVDGAKGTLSIT